MKKKLVTLGLWCIALAVVVFGLSYGMFHHLTDSGFTAVWQPEAGKPFVTEMVADLGVLLLGSGIVSLLAANILFDPIS